MKRLLSSFAPALVALAVLAFAVPASAQIAGHNVNVSATVNRACTVTTGAGADVNLTTTLTDLGNIPDSAAAGLSVRCTRGTAVSVQATTASGRLATCSTAATCGAETIGYDLYVSQSGWGAGVAPALLGNTAVPLGASSNRGDLATINYVARFTAGGDPLAGTYTGQVAVTYTVSP